MKKGLRTAFADDMLADGFELNSATVIFNVQAVYEAMLYPDTYKFRENIKENSIKLLATNPLFNHCFMEWTRNLRQEMLNNDEKVDIDFVKSETQDLQYLKTGFYMVACDALDSTGAAMVQGYADLQNWGKDYLEQYKVYLCEAFVGGDFGFIAPYKHGMVLAWDRQTGIFESELSGIVTVHPNGIPEYEFQVMYGIPLTGFLLMHRKAPVVLVEMPRNVRRRVERKTGKNPSNYFYIDVDSLTERKRYESNGSRKNAKPQAHLVRGHWRYNREHGIAHMAHKAFWIETFAKGGESATQRNYRIVIKESK